MKRLLTISLICISLAVQAQYSATLPSGFIPFSTQMYYKITGGDTLFVQGASGKGFHYFTPSRTLLDSLFLKVDKIPGKGLSTEDYTTAEKSKLAGIEAGAEVNVNADWSAVSGDAMILNKPTFVATESDPVFLGQKGAVNGVATLNSSGKIPNSQIPALALVDTYVVGSQAAMLALSTAEQGDVAIRTDLSKTFILTDNNYSTLASWKELLSPVIPAETDPIWGASPSAGITSTNISNWNTAYTYSQVGHLPLGGGTLTGGLNGTTATMSGKISFAGGASILDVSGYTIFQDKLANNRIWFGHAGDPRTLYDLPNNTTSHVFRRLDGTAIATFSGTDLATTLNGPVSAGVIAAPYLYKAYSSSGTAGSPVYEQILGYGFSSLSKGALEFGNEYNSNVNTLFRIKLNNVSDVAFYPLTLSSSGATFSSLIGSGERIVFTNSGGTIVAGTIGTGLSWDATNKILSATGGATGTVTGTGTAGYIPKWNSASDIGNSIISESGSTISVAGSLSISQLLYVDRNTADNVSGYLRNTSSTGYGAKIQGGSTGRYSLLVTNFLDATLLNVSNEGSTFNTPVIATSFTGAGSGLTSLPSNTALYPTLNQSTTGNAATATNSTLWQGWDLNYSAEGTTLAYLFGGDGSAATQRYYTSTKVKAFLGIDAGTTFANNISGNAGTATFATQWNGYTFDNSTVYSSGFDYIFGRTTSTGQARLVTAGGLQSFLGLGSAAYTASSAYYSSTNPSGYITGINSSMVTTALGYTPANSTYTISGIGTPTISGITNVSFTTNYDNHYIRVGNEVTVRGKFLLQPVGTGLTVVRVSFPTSPDPTRGSDSAVGSASGIGIANGQINMHVGTTSAEITMNATTPIGNEVYYEFTYTAL